MSHGSITLGRADILRLQSEGWKFPSTGYVRVGNGWAGLAIDDRGDFSLQVISDPKDEPEKWIDDSPVPEQSELAFGMIDR